MKSMKKFQLIMGYTLLILCILSIIAFILHALKIVDDSVLMRRITPWHDSNMAILFGLISIAGAILIKDTSNK